MWRAHVKPAAVPGRHWCDHGAVLCNHTTQKAQWELSCLIPCSAQKQPGTERSWEHLSVSFHHSMSGKMWLTSQRRWSNRIPERSTANWIDFVVMAVRSSLMDRLIVKVTAACLLWVREAQPAWALQGWVLGMQAVLPPQVQHVGKIELFKFIRCFISFCCKRWHSQLEICYSFGGCIYSIMCMN